MSILVDEASRVIIQGITGQVGLAFAERMARHYRNFVGGVTPGKGGQAVHGRPVFESVAEAVAATGANASVVIVPPAHAPDAMLEAIDAGIGVMTVYTEGVPLGESMRVLAYARSRGVTIIGPNAAGVVSPGKASLSELSEDVLPLAPGPVGIVAKSGSITYEVLDRMRGLGIGQSTVCCLGGDPVVGMRLDEALVALGADPETQAIVLCGEVGGTDEVEAARHVPAVGKPVLAYVSGRHAPPGRKIGHAGAIVGDKGETAAAKLDALAAAGAIGCRSLPDLIPALAAALGIDRPAGRPERSSPRGGTR